MTMTKQGIDQTAPEANQGLPFSVKKTVPLKIYGVMLLIVIIVLTNISLFHQEKIKQKPDEVIDNYSVSPVNSMAQNQPTHTSRSNSVNQDKFKKELEQAKAKDFIERLQADQTVSSPVITTAATASQAYPNHSFAERLSWQPYLIGQGRFIFATLTVAIHSDLTGQVNAIVNQDIYGEQGHYVLIPRGSRLMGEYRSILSNNQSRLFLVWTRVIEPNGISIMIGSEGTDTLGQAGMTGNVNKHFLERFGTATLISLIGAGASSPGNEYNSIAYRQAVSQAMAQQASSTLEQNASIPPTIHVKQGERVVVFVNKDLDFSQVIR